jgi:gas vesicle protein
MNINDTKSAPQNTKPLQDDFVNDFQKVKDKACDACGALYDTANHAKDKAGKIIKNSLDNLQQQTDEIQENVVTYTTRH